MSKLTDNANSIGGLEQWGCRNVFLVENEKRKQIGNERNKEVQ